jgi:hypothetical protein
MRTGENPLKAAPALGAYAQHRIIMPVFIPSLEGYFERSLEVLRICLESLRLTASGRASVTLISNSSAPEVNAELERQRTAGWVDQLLYNAANRGKVDAAVSVARGAFEPLITVADCDVLFKAGWIDAIERLFRTFPECGFACPFPNPNNPLRYTTATVLGALATRELAREKVVPDEDLDAFAHSVGNPEFFKSKRRGMQMIIRRGGETAVIGGRHFVFTMRREVLQGMPRDPALSAISPESDKNWFDLPPDRLGYWRLSPPRAFVYHMGNVIEPWMYDALERCRREAAAGGGCGEAVPAARRRLISRVPMPVRRLMLRAVNKFWLKDT